jgi:hypothetical protein
MTYSLRSLIRSSLSLSFAGLLAGLFSAACDLPDKNLGNDDGAGSTTDGGACQPGETMMLDCNTCSCEDGHWACTEIACDPTVGDDGTTDGGTCDPADDPSDECNSCSCHDGHWACTEIACEPTGVGTCDPADNPTNGCNACGCEHGEWTCTAEECPEHPAVEICGDDEPSDPLTITHAAIAGDTLLVSVSHGGGCVAHGYGSCWDGLFAESDPVQTWLKINHEDNDDPCDAIVTAELSFDLTPMRDAYQQPSGTIIVHVADWGSLDYSF